MFEFIILAGLIRTQCSKQIASKSKVWLGGVLFFFVLGSFIPWIFDVIGAVRYHERWPEFTLSLGGRKAAPFLH